MSWGKRGQAMTEMAMLGSALTLLMLGAADLGRAYYLNIELSGASRAGMRNGVLNGSTDIGQATRSEPNSAIPSTVITWGDTARGQVNDCDPNTPSHSCGDPTGCPPAVFTGGRLVCFAVRTCTPVSGVCASPSAWGVRPAQGADALGSGQALQVRVVYKFAPLTPFIANFSPGGAFYLTSDTLGLELY